MGEQRGVVYMAFGDKAHEEVEQAITSLRRVSEVPIFVVDESFCGVDVWGIPRGGPFTGQRVFLPGRVKPLLWRLSPFEHSLYLDADTRVMSDPEPLFGLLELGWDFAVCPGQAARFLRETMFGQAEKAATEEELGTGLLYYYNSGVFLWRRNERTEALFAEWGTQWERFGGWDEQLALMRALWRVEEVKFLTLPVCWNQRKREGARIYHDTGNRRCWGNISAV